MDDWQIREAVRDDQAGILPLLSALRRETAELGVSVVMLSPERIEANLRTYLEDPRHLVLIARRGDQTLGFIRMMARRDGEWLKIAPHPRPPRSLGRRGKDWIRAALAWLEKAGRQQTPEPAALYLGDIYVAPDARLQGIGKALVREALARLAPLCAGMVYLNALVRNERGRAFWSALGFVEESVVMTRKLADSGAGRES